jgi:hypothetical protein
MKNAFLLAGLAVSIGIAGPVVSFQSGDPKGSESRKVEFARDILPILSKNCFTCHGPDDNNRKGGLRLDSADTARKTLKSGNRAIVPGDAKHSELVTRIFLKDSDRMPPPKSHLELKDAEKQLLARWIKEGARYQQHWAFVAPKRPVVPMPKTPGWAKNPIDRFILARLEAESLKPSPEADRHTLARRVSIDLTGLPPTLAAVDQFVKDRRPDAYERFVDQVLKSPAYGERWAHVWLDLGRYADSNGYAEDQPRTIWKFRDWVIDAINNNLPFDQFTIEQIAGDLLPDPVPSQLIATAFHRNTLTNTEGGTDDEEFRVAAVVDRVNTTLQVWMGVTMGCAQCHTHKYDPISQEEYFRFYAIFNQTQDADKPDNSPVLALPNPAQQEQKAKLEKDIARLDKQLNASTPELEAAQQSWEAQGPKEKLPANVIKILAVDANDRTDAQKAELAKYYRSIAPELKAARSQVAALRKQLAGVQSINTPIMRELPDGKKRVTKIHNRGNFLDQGKVVTPGVPALFPPLPSDQPANRIALARWLVAPDNPLTARVTVNRYWEQIFGIGLMETPDDYGIRGKLPTHPELLDWLAVEFAGDSGGRSWDVKKLLRLIVTSATYRQLSRVAPELLERDPDNRLYARGPRFRSSAEVVRDQALFVSGLLSAKTHGPSVRPPQPKIGLNAAFGPGTDWIVSTGEDKHRRALYTQWRRTTPYPSMTTFDVPSRTVCTVTRPRTNTPLQALVTLNDPVFVEAAQALARRMIKDGGDTVESRVSYGFRLCLTRPPHEKEVQRLADLFAKARSEYARSPKEALQLATDPLGPLPTGMDAVEVAAWTVVSNVLLNLDEMFAKR